MFIMIATLIVLALNIIAGFIIFEIMLVIIWMFTLTYGLFNGYGNPEEYPLIYDTPTMILSTTDMIV